MSATKMGSMSAGREFTKDEPEKFEMAAKSRWLHFLPLCRCFSSFYSQHNAAVVLYIMSSMAALHMPSGQHAFVLVKQMHLSFSGRASGFKWGCSGPPLLLGLNGKPKLKGAGLGLLTGPTPPPIRMLSMLLCWLYVCTHQPCCQPWLDYVSVNGCVYWPKHRVKK